jgi:5-methyltetrahydropteroyltriglutamate--homocysteine methyltransferase
MLRPQALSDARERFGPGSEELRAAEDAAVDECIAIQERAGVDVVTDGEMRRFLFTAPMTESVEGIAPIEESLAPKMIWHGDREHGDFEYALPVAIVAPLRPAGALALAEFAYAREQASRPVKVTLPSPMMLSSFYAPAVSAEAYPDPFDAFADGAAIIREQIDALDAAGCRHIQIDAPELATHLLNEDQRAHWAARGISPERMLSDGVELLDSLVRGTTARTTLHICRGNFGERWMGSGGYAQISRQLFSRAASYDAFALEYDTERAGDFAPLRDVPEDKTVVLGLVSTKTDALESADELRQRIAEAAQIIDHDRLALSTQCGFASSAIGNPIEFATQERKLTLVADVAHAVWP